MQFDERQFRKFLSEQDISDILDDLAAAIITDYGMNDKVLLVGVLKGAVVVTADLVRLRHDEAAPDGVAGELHAVSHAQLLEHVRAVAVDGLLADEELLGDLLASKPLSDQLDDLELARRCTRKPDGAESNLISGDARRLVRLHVRSQRQPVQDAVRRHPVEVVRETVEVDHGHGRLERRELLRWFGRFERGERRAALRCSLHVPQS